VATGETRIGEKRVPATNQVTKQSKGTRGKKILSPFTIEGKGERVKGWISVKEKGGCEDRKGRLSTIGKDRAGNISFQGKTEIKKGGMRVREKKENESGPKKKVVTGRQDGTPYY